MHAPEYTAKIKALIAAKDTAEVAMRAILYQFRDGRKPNPADIVAARQKWAEALAIVDPEDSVEPEKTGHAYVGSGSGFCGICDDMPGEGNHKF